MHIIFGLLMRSCALFALFALFAFVFFGAPSSHDFIFGAIFGYLQYYRVAKTHRVALSCRSFFAKEPLIVGLFCGM